MDRREFLKCMSVSAGALTFGGLAVQRTGGQSTMDDVVRTADAFFTPVHLRVGQALRFTLKNGQARRVLVVGVGVDVYDDFGEPQHTLWADVTVDGQPLRLVYSPYRMKALYEPKVINGMRIALDGLKVLSKATGITSRGNEAAEPPADVRLWVNDATLPVIPNCGVWSDLYQDQTTEHDVSNWEGPRYKDYRIRQDRDIHVRDTTLSKTLKTGWMGAWTYGLHEGVDLVLPVGTALYVVTDGAVHRGVVSDGHRIWYSVTRPNGDVWWFGNSHCQEMVGEVDGALKAGDVYARSGKKTSRGTARWAHAHAWLRLESASSGTYHLNAWPVMWQGIENKKEKERVIQAAIEPVYATDAGQEIAFSSAGSRPGLGRQQLSYRWYFDDGTISDAAHPKKSFAEPGLHQAILVVSDGQHRDLAEVFFTIGQGGAATPQVTLEPFAAPLLPRMNEQVTLSMRAAGLPGHELTFSWDFGDGATAEGRTVTHAFTRPGRHYAIARVRDNTTGRSRMDWYMLDLWEWPTTHSKPE